MENQVSSAREGDLREAREVCCELMRSFPVDVAEHSAGTTIPCSYHIHYPRPAEDMNAWNLHYLEHHPSIMRTFPNVRGIEIYTSAMMALCHCFARRHKCDS